LIDDRPLRPRREIVLERFNTVRRSLRKRLDASIRTIAHVPNYLVPRGGALRKESITNSLNVTAY
jgi:hypothetical protein